MDAPCPGCWGAARPRGLPRALAACLLFCPVINYPFRYASVRFTGVLSCKILAGAVHQVTGLPLRRSSGAKKSGGFALAHLEAFQNGVAAAFSRHGAISGRLPAARALLQGAAHRS